MRRFPLLRFDLIFLKIKHDLMRPILCYGEVLRFFKTLQSFDQIIKNVSSSTTHKKLRLSVFMSLRLYVFPSFREFKKILPNTFIYKSILIIIYMNTNIIKTKIFHINKYDLKGHLRSQKVICLSANLRKFF